MFELESDPECDNAQDKQPHQQKQFETETESLINFIHIQLTF